MTADDPATCYIVGGHSLRLRAIALALRGPPLQQSFERRFQFTPRMFVTDFRRNRDTGPESLFGFVLLSELLIELSELIVRRYILRIVGLDRFEFPQRIVMLTELRVFESQGVA